MRRLLCALFALWLSALPALAFENTGANLTGFGSTTIIPATVSFVGCTALDTNLTTFSFATHATGTAAADRATIVGVLAEDGQTTFSINSATIGGLAATALGTGANDTGSLVNARFFGLDNAVGTTATIEFTLSEAATGGAICVWAVYGLLSITPRAENQDFETASAATALSVNTKEDGIVLGISINDAITVTDTWTGLTERADASSGEYSRSAADFDEDDIVGTPLTITDDWTGTGDAVAKVIVLR